MDHLFSVLEERFAHGRLNRVDGLKIDLDQGWVHLRKSNTEPIIRLYAEAGTVEEAEALAGEVMKCIQDII
jgi:phosphomannomutase